MTNVSHFIQIHSKSQAYLPIKVVREMSSKPPKVVDKKFLFKYVKARVKNSKFFRIIERLQGFWNYLSFQIFLLELL